MDLWGAFSTWEVINYDGAFFRAEGTNANAFIGKSDVLVKQNSANLAHTHNFTGTAVNSEDMSRNQRHAHGERINIDNDGSIPTGTAQATLPLVLAIGRTGAEGGGSGMIGASVWGGWEEDPTAYVKAPQVLTEYTNLSHTHSVTANGTNSWTGENESRPSNFTIRVWKRTA